MELREEIEETADPTKLQEIKEKVCLSDPWLQVLCHVTM
jgi:hypothetical protein